MPPHDTSLRSLDTRLLPLRPAEQWAPPPRGWIRAIRDALGMTTAQLARRLRVSQPRIVALEKAEAQGAASLDTLAKAARALDCTLVYALVPNRPLQQMVHARAEAVAAAHLRAARHSMLLEDQSTDEATERAQYEAVIEELLRGRPARLWDESASEP
ncbi:mobile mystery protein A [Desertibaculum subflavum]|uniref:mobile mystery protein A n=1 Tax=Desertibaculum subflavum TaxID=2268458 RepID=UPI000E67203D